MKDKNVYFYKIRELLVLFLFCNVYKEKIFTTEIEDGRETPCKTSSYILKYQFLLGLYLNIIV